MVRLTWNIACRAELGLAKEATLLDVIVHSVVQQAMAGRVQYLVELRETTQGKTPNKNLNISAAMEAFLQDEGFRNFLEAHHGDFMEKMINSGIRWKANAIPVSSRTPFRCDPNSIPV